MNPPDILPDVSPDAIPLPACDSEGNPPDVSQLSYAVNWDI